MNSSLLQARTLSVPAFAALVILALAFSSTRSPAAPVWLPVTQADLDATASKIDPEANIEILHRLEEFDDDDDRFTVYRSYQRIKVFNEKGVRELDKIDIHSAETTTLKTVHARVIKPDGSIVSIDKKNFFTRDIIRYRRHVIKVTSFTFPGLTPGCIVEWQCEADSTESTGAQRINFQGPAPARICRVRYRPTENHSCNFTFIGCPPLRRQRDKDRFYTIEKHNIPALKTEPFMPPVDEVQQWMIFHMGSSHTALFEGRVLAPLFEALETFIAPPKSSSRKSSAILDKSREITAGAANDREKLARIHDFCRSSIRNTWRESPGRATDELKKPRAGKTVADVLARGHGDPFDITALFVALARAAGFEMCFALCSDCSERYFDRRRLIVSRPTDIIAGVSLLEQDAGGENATRRETYYYDPASTYLPAEKLHWSNQGTGICVYRRAAAAAADSPQRPRRTVIWGATEAATAAGAVRKRTGTFRLDAEGTLEGEVRIEPRGQFEFDTKNRHNTDAEEASASHIRASVLERLPNAEVTDIVVLNASSPTEPLSITYRIRVPGYADMAGRRMFVQPAFFQKGAPAMFTAGERAHNIYLTFPWVEEDTVSITLPEGCVIEELSRSAPFPPSADFTYSSSLAHRKTTNTLLFKREFTFKAKEIPSSEYAPLKAVFDGIHEQDSSTIMLSAIPLN